MSRINLQLLNKISGFLYELLPSRCAVCGMPLAYAETGLLCSVCRIQVVSHFPVHSNREQGRCRCCGRAVPWPLHRCDRCNRAGFPFRAVSRFPFAPPVSGLIRALKFSGKSRLSRDLGSFLAELTPDLPECDLVCWVPLSRSRYRIRGYNQAELIARVFAARLSCPAEPLLQRITNTRPQARLNSAERTANVRGAFRCTEAASVCGKRIVLVDDVFTTGATVAACAECLVSAGAGSITVVTVAAG